MITVPAVNPEDELDTSNFDDAFLSMPAEIADTAEDAPADEEDNGEDKKEPQAEFDEEGRDVFEGYSFQVQDDAVSLVETVEELNEAAESTAQLGAKPHPADAPETTILSSTGPQPLQQDEEVMSSSAQSTSTRMTHGDRDVSMGQSGHSTDSSTATSEVHPKEASAGQASSERNPSEIQAPEPSEVVREEEGEDDWDVVEQEDQVAQNGRLLNGRRGGISKGKTLFQRGVPDRCKPFSFRPNKDGQLTLFHPDRCLGRRRCCATNTKTFCILSKQHKEECRAQPAVIPFFVSGR